jgi:hypothetical protein
MGELAAIFRRHGPASRAKFKDRLLPRHLAAMEAMEHCRTAALGGHLSQCPTCGALAYSSHAGKNRHGPKCQHEATTRWLQQPRALLLPVSYVLVTCTLPEALRPVARSHQRGLSTLLFQTSAAAVQALPLDPHSLGGPIGMVGVLHPWTRDLASHPHVHSLVPGGALSPEGSQWLSPRSAAWLVPVRALSQLFRGKFKAALTTAGLCEPVPPQGWDTDGVTHGPPAGTGTEGLASFAPSISRIALSHNRLEAHEDGSVTFRVKKRTGAGGKRLTLPADAFIHRFLPHGLPRGCIKVRSDGLLRPSRRKVLPQLSTLLAACPSHARGTERAAPRDRPQTRPARAPARRCRTCGEPLVCLRRLSPHPREPPSYQRAPLIPGWCPEEPDARQGVLDPVGTACGDLSGLRTHSPS